jgi:hypothetical protein
VEGSYNCLPIYYSGTFITTLIDTIYYYRILTNIIFFLQKLQQKEDFTPEQIDEFQSGADDFFSKWLDLVGYDGLTNYIHMLGAGHIRYYLVKWKNLNRFQNQGWEAYNAMITAFWHHRTKKEGGRIDCLDQK